MWTGEVSFRLMEQRAGRQDFCSEGERHFAGLSEAFSVGTQVKIFPVASYGFSRTCSEACSCTAVVCPCSSGVQTQILVVIWCLSVLGQQLRSGLEARATSSLAVRNPWGREQSRGPGAGRRPRQLLRYWPRACSRLASCSTR